MKDILIRITDLHTQVQESKPLKKEDDDRLWRKFRLEWNYNSNHIEGNTLTYGQTELLLMFDKTTGDHELREYEEMKAHDAVVQLVRAYASEKERELSEADIREWNKIILVRPYWKEAITADGQPTRKLVEPGRYKKTHNSVRLNNGELFHYASPGETPLLMNELIQWYRNEEIKAELHPLQLAALFHYKFVRIHPFDDSNGRTARLLMNFTLMKHGYPPVIIKSADKRNYLFALNKADTGDLDAFVEYVAKELLWSLELSIRASKGQSLDEPGDLDKKIDVLKRQLDQKDIATKPISSSLTYEIIKNSLFPIFESFERECSKLKDLFIDYDRQIQVNIGGSQLQVGDKTSSWNDLVSNWLEGSIVTKQKIIQSLDYFFQLKGFKKSVEHQYVSTRLQIQFNEFSYSILINNDHTKRRNYPYDSPLSHEEINLIVNVMVNHLIDQISSAGGLQRS